MRPVAANLRAFMFRIAHHRHEEEDFVRGYYFAADLMGCQLARSLVTSYQECFARIDLQRPHDLNALIRLICQLNFVMSENLEAEFEIPEDNSTSRLALAAIVTDTILAGMTATAQYVYQRTGSDLQRAAWPAFLPDWT